MPVCNGIFEGGGVKGIGLAGAVYGLEQAGYSFANVGGTSAGAIVASLIAAGYSGKEIKHELENLDYRKFREKDMLDHFGAFGKVLNISMKMGIYRADYFEKWLHGLLERKGKTSFGQIRVADAGPHKYRFQAAASDLTSQKLLVLPDDLRYFGFDPDHFSIAKAVRMSMSIPIFYEPYHLIDSWGREHIIVDGGLLSNYPLWLLDDGRSRPQIPTFGFRFTTREDQALGHDGQSISGIFDYMKALTGTLLDAHDKYYISNSKGDFQRSILIPVTVTEKGKQKEVRSTDFELSKEAQKGLFINGQKAAEEFLANWDFEKWRQKYRG
ncbi:MAG: patatin-like phospholipase family protein [Clostridiales bacterium]|jgi:NTE family protein|nr:patatin-like phospholipase family protein [Clostridiales bacterium]